MRVVSEHQIDSDEGPLLERVWSDGSVTCGPAASQPPLDADGFPLPLEPDPVPPTPDIAALAQAIVSSPSIDQPTKDAIVAALEGGP